MHTEREGDGMAQARHVAHGRTQTARACTCGRRVQQGWAVTGACVGVTLNGVLSVRRRRGGELDREGVGRGHTIGGRAPAHSAYSARRVHGRLCSGLGGMLLAAAA
jgi:hypothetical protein